MSSPNKPQPGPDGAEAEQPPRRVTLMLTAEPHERPDPAAAGLAAETEPVPAAGAVTDPPEARPARQVIPVDWPLEEDEETLDLHPQKQRPRGYIYTLNRLSDHDSSLQLLRRNKVVGALRPARVRSGISWRSRPGLYENGLLTNDHLRDLYTSYQSARPEPVEGEEDNGEWRSAWMQRETENLKAATAEDERIGDLHFAALAAYYEQSLAALTDQGVLDSEEKFNAALERLAYYDAIKDNRDELQSVLEGLSQSKGRRMMGYVAVRSAYRAAVWPLTFGGEMVFRLFASRDTEVGPEGVRLGRRIRNVTTVGLLGAATIYLETRSRGSTAFLSAVTPDAVPPVKPTVPVVPVPPVDQTPAALEFTQAALTTSSGEGWASELAQAGITYSPAFMNHVGPHLQELGYAYHTANAQGGTDWFMNAKDVDKGTLTWLVDQAKAAGAYHG